MNETEQETKTLPLRTKSGRFVKGQSGNPKGPPKGNISLGRYIRQYLEGWAQGADHSRLESLVARLYVEDPKTLLAYGYGKPIETHEVSTTSPIEINVKPTINIEQLRVVAGAILGISGPDNIQKPVHPAITDTKTSDVPERGGS